MNAVNGSLAVTLIVSAIIYGTPLLLAGLGELLTERSGVLNLGVEGMMLMGAVTAFWVVQTMSGPAPLVLLIAVLAAAFAGGVMALIHAFVSVTLRANQIVSGLALTIFAGIAGLSSYLGVEWNLAGQARRYNMSAFDVAGLGDLPVVGPILFHQDALVYLSWILVVAVSWYLYRSRPGLNLRSVGESPAAADAMGIPVTAYRYWHTVVGGALAGIGGSYFTLALSAQWTNGLTSGAGWIAIALVIFAFWRPGYLLIGAYFFGLLSGLGFDLQARGVHWPGEFFSALPYLMTVIALVVMSTGWARRQLGTPAALGTPYAREGG